MINLITNKTKCADNSTNKIQIESRFLRKNTDGTYRDVTSDHSYYEIKSNDDLMFVRMTFGELAQKESIVNLKMLLHFAVKTKAFLKVIKCQSSDIGNVTTIASQIENINEFSDSVQVSANSPENEALYFDLSNISSEISNTNNSLMFAVKFIKVGSGTFRITPPDILAEFTESIFAVVTEVCGTSSLYRFDENDFGINGKVNVNLFDGTPNYSICLFSTPGKRLPISLSLFHNPNSNKIYAHFPFGVVPSFYYEASESPGIVKIKDPADNYTVYKRLVIPSTGDEKEKFLRNLGIKEISDYNGIYYSDIDNSYLFTLSVNFVKKIEVHDKNGNIMLFEQNSTYYRLKEIRNSLDHWIRYTWNGNKLNKLQNVDGEEMIFSYTGNYIAKVQIPSLFRCYCFDYSTANSIIISENDYTLSTSNVETKTLLNSTKLVFDNARLRQIFDANNYCLQMNYSTEIYQIADIALFSNNGEKKYKTTYTYLDKCTKVSDLENNELYYYFDNLGRCVNIMDKEGRTVSFNYDKFENGLSKHLIGQSNVQSNSVNLLDNHSFERDVAIPTESSTSWYKSSGANVSVENGGIYGGKCLKIVGSSSQKTFVRQTIGGASSNCKIRAFVKHEDISNDDLANIKIGFEYSYRVKTIENGTTIIKNVSDEKYCKIRNNENKWYEISESISIPKRVLSAIITVVIELNNVATTLYIDEVEVGGTYCSIRNNLVENGDLSSTENNLPKGWETENLHANDGIITNSLLTSDEHRIILGGSSFKFKAGDIEFDSEGTEYKPKKRKLFKQIEINGIAGEEFVYSVYGKANVSDNTIFRSYIIFNSTDGSQERYDFDFEKHFDNWQMLTRGVVVNKNFSSVVVGVEFDGCSDAFVDCFQLYKDSFGTAYSYDKFGNIIDVVGSGNNSTLMTYDNDNRLETFSSSNGTFFRYVYDAKGRLSKIQDIKGNMYEYTYDDEDQVVQQTLTTKEGEVITNSVTYDSENRQETCIDEFNKKTVLVRDYLDRITSQKYNNQIEERYQYNGKSELIKLTGILSNLESASNALQYDSLGNTSLLTSDNGTQYELSYDKFGNVTQVKCCGEILQTYTYSPLDANSYSKELLLSSKIGESGSTYYFEYDSKNRLTTVKIDNTILCEYLYDKDGNVLRIADKLINNDYHYSYDLSGNVENVYAENGTDFKYHYDNLNNLQKAIYKINGKYRSIDYQYDYEMNEYTQEGFIKTFGERKGHDVVVGFDMDKGLYGLKSIIKNVDTEFDQDADLRIARFNKNNSTAVFELSSCNKNRIGKNLAITQEKWDFNFNIAKVLFMWIKPTNTLAQQDILLFEKDTSEDGNYTQSNCLSKLRILSDGRLAYYSGTSNDDVLISENKVKLNEWNLVGISLENSQWNALRIVLNDKIYLGAHRENVSAITHIAVLRSGINVPTTATNLTMSVDLAFMSIGTEWISDKEINLLYKEGKKLMFSGQKHQSMTTVYYDDKLYQDFDVITLNGSLESAKGISPASIVETINKNDHLRRRVFKYDSETKKQILGVFSSEYELSTDNSIKLGYDLGLGEAGTISVRFKLDGSVASGKKRTLIGSSTSGLNKLCIYVNNEQYLAYEINGVEYDTTQFVSLDAWHHLGISFKPNQLIITLDGQTIETSKSIDLSGTITYIGTNALNANSEGNALFEMFAYKHDWSDSLVLEELATKGQSTVVREHFDNIGRKANQETIVSGYNYNVSYTYNKTRVTKEVDSSGETIQYGYSNNYGILGQIIHKQDDQEIYREQVEYDKLLRITSETDELGGNHTYSYDKNGNILSHAGYRNGINFEYRYSYDSTISDKLLTVSDTVSGKTVIFEYSTTNKFLPTKIRYSDGISKALSWQGKRLIEIIDNNIGIIKYKYNAQGLRTSKIVNGNETSFIYEGTDLVQMTKNNQCIDFIYDATGFLIGLNTSEGQYFYRRDITGNILGILDKTGNYVVKYRYDAWGNVLRKQVLVDCIVSNHNPFLYKGYFYDEETKWYYLQSRYYIPEWGRFLSPDSIDYVDPESIGGLNLYAYCNNNPINYVDPSGHVPQWLKWLAIGLAVVGGLLVAGAITALTMGVGTTIMATSLAGAVIHGAAIGTLIGAGVGTAIGGIIGGATTNWSTEGILTGMGIGFGSGAIIGAVVGGSVGGLQYTNAVTKWGAAGGRTPQENMIHHFKKHVIGDNHGYLGKNVIQYTKNACSFFKDNRSLMKLSGSGNYLIRAYFAGHKSGGYYDLVGVIYSFF